METVGTVYMLPADLRRAGVPNAQGNPVAWIRFCLPLSGLFVLPKNVGIDVYSGKNFPFLHGFLNSLSV